MSINKILVPLDGSELASKALPSALSIARRIDAQLCLVTVATGKAGDLAGNDSAPSTLCTVVPQSPRESILPPNQETSNAISDKRRNLFRAPQVQQKPIG